MVSAVGIQHRHAPHVEKKTDKLETSATEGPGKSAQSVGHRAKAMVAASGDTEPGAQGRAASMIARMDVTVLVPPPPTETTDTGSETVEPEAPLSPTDSTDVAPATDGQDALPPVGTIDAATILLEAAAETSAGFAGGLDLLAALSTQSR